METQNEYKKFKLELDNLLEMHTLAVTDHFDYDTWSDRCDVFQAEKERFIQYWAVKGWIYRGNNGNAT